MAKLEDIVDVDLPCEGTYKFILVEASEGTDKKYVLVGDPGCGYHSDIYSEYRRGHPEIKTGIFGGGRIRVTSKELYAYGESISYGAAPQEIVEKLLKEYATEKDLLVKVEMGVGY